MTRKFRRTSMTALTYGSRRYEKLDRTMVAQIMPFNGDGRDIIVEYWKNEQDKAADMAAASGITDSWMLKAVDGKKGARDVSA